LGLGETNKIVLNSYDTVFDVGQLVMEAGGVPTKPGEYGFGTGRPGLKRGTQWAIAELEAEARTRSRHMFI
jgi:hypothetical protein